MDKEKYTLKEGRRLRQKSLSQVKIAGKKNMRVDFRRVVQMHTMPTPSPRVVEKA
jgi:hypothetical protein